MFQALTCKDLLEITERLTPAKLFMRTPADRLDEDLQTQLHAVLFRHTVDPRQRNDDLEYLPLLMQQGLTPDPKAYLLRVFLPWIALRRRLDDARERIEGRFERMSNFDDDPIAAASHAAMVAFASCVKATWAINEIMKICETLADPASRRTVRAATGEIAGLIFTDLMLPIIDTYPELKPSYLTDC